MKKPLPVPPHVLSFSQADSLFARLAPLSPYGKERVAEIGFFTDFEALESFYDDIEAAGAALDSLEHSARRDKLFWHLSRLTRIPESLAGTSGNSAPGSSGAANFSASNSAAKKISASSPSNADAWGLMELFLVKKFLVHYKGIFELLDDEARTRFGFFFSTQELLDVLSAGGSDAESFSISERHEPALAAVRARIARLSETALERRRKLQEAARTAYGIDFAGREMLILPVDKALDAMGKGRLGQGPLLAAEPYDSRSMMIRLVPDTELLEAEEARRKARDEEKLLEQAAIVRLSALVVAAKDALQSYCRAVKRFDYSLAQWKLAQELGMVRPRLRARGTACIQCHGARFIPLEEECRERGVAYMPLDFELDTPVGILSGSNMGGKTCVLQTLVFLQLLAQCGMFVPAAAFETVVFGWIDVIGAAGESRGRGLSAYGFEIRRLIEVLHAAKNEPGFAVFDEFAHTTSAKEAQALMQAAVEQLASLSGTVALFATHIECSLPEGKGTAYRMAGLDSERARSIIESTPAQSERSLDALLAQINSLMQYKVIRTGKASAHAKSDALAVARLLGLDKDLVDRAQELLAESDTRRAPPAQDKQKERGAE